MRDLHRNLDAVQSLTPAARTASANGTGVDLQFYEGCEVEWDVGVITDGTHTPKLQESDDNATFTDVAAVDQFGALAALATGVHQRAGYRGAKRYVRAVITVGGATTGGVYAATVIRGHKRHKVGPAV